MKHRSILLLAALALMVYSCQNKPENGNDMTLSPESGTTYKSGEPVNVKIRLDPSTKFDSVVYMLDSTRLGAKKDTSALTIKTDTLPLGAKTLTAKVYNGGKDHDASSNFVLLAAKAPEEFTYKVEKKYPHDTSAYTEGFLYKDGYIYESTGNTGKSAIQKSDLETGKVLQKQLIDPKYFGEGSVIVGNKIIMLTWKDKIGYVFDKSTLKVLSTFNDNVGVEGWGMTTDGNKIYRDDSTNRIWFMDKDTYHATGYIDVCDDKGPIDSLNELEYINGKIFSNRYTHDVILVIDPKTGAVLQKVDMSNLWPKSQHPASYTDSDENNNVLNGIAWDEKGKRLLVTGKKWPYIYQISLIKK
ncbi:glutaminyl-peptide cyclotransferase [Mucilaginibacter sp. dw_454]|uniref:glutaminyl-peptide cyclotransferase n=1 Tax=Mucilaginibacter sp. dw_454 TaxID=2720079 RepID=UPI001BD4ED0C|nr:glutaminyl-peptide cyclotransferase [Mucilaginibacter sp. dw_454]